MTKKIIRGKGTWNLNCDLLYNEDYIKLVNETIEHLKIEYAIPVYNPNKIGNIEDELIQFTISNKLFLEMLLLKLRYKTIQFRSKLKKDKQ